MNYELNNIENFYLSQSEMNQACLLAARKIILDQSKEITEHWKYGAPFFYFRKKMFCYFWVDAKKHTPYIGITDGALIDHPALEQGDRKRMKILHLNPDDDLPMKAMREILAASINIRNNQTT